MAYKPNITGPVRDKIYPSQVAAQRPIMAPRLHCSQDNAEEYSPELSIRGDSSDDRVARFNEQLRSGLGTGRPDNNDE